MRRAEDIKRMIKKTKIKTNPEVNEAVLNGLFNRLDKANSVQINAKQPNIGRIIMKSHLTKIASAALVTIAAIVGITIVNRTSSIVLADVLEQIRQVNAVFYQQKMNSTTPMMGMEMNQDVHSKVWISGDYGMRMDMEMEMTIANDPNKHTSTSQGYFLFEQNEIVTIMPSEKQYMRVELSGEQITAARQQSNDPNLMIEQFLNCDYVSIGKTTIDGIEVEEFQTTDPNFQGGVYKSGQVDVKLWVDVKTKLPVQMEMDIQLGGQTNISMHSITYGFQWDVPVDAAIFEPVIPDDYTSATSGTLDVSVDEDAIIEGLKLYNDMFGKYPETLDLAGLLSPLNDFMQNMQEMSKDSNDLPPFMKNMEEEMKGLSEDEQKQKGMDLGMQLSMSVTGLQSFHAQLVKEDKNPAYYGDKVKAGDAGFVLMRWKVSDFDYRVIFGDLTVETITFETLVQLEQNLPEE
ncbi:MAG: hypothetical protein JXA96_18200 [Sedimentisphaerales bacterium]|nr:hypothetical protein [Sedimentisphaerales bacterium]